VSEDSGIRLFEPRPSSAFPDLGLVVWAIDESHLVNYLLPRDCPRVTFTPASATTAADRERFRTDGCSRVIVVATNWLARIAAATLYVYRMPDDAFELHDGSAGYWISSKPVIPVGVVAVSDVRREIAARKADLRTVAHLPTFADAVSASTLDFSIIRLRNAVL